MPDESRDPLDFRDFVLGRGPTLSRIAFLLTGDHHLAQDLLQSALATTYQHWNRVRDGNPEAYVRRALHNTYISWWRRHRPSAPLASAPEPAVTDGTEGALHRVTVLNALHALTPRQRTVVVLRYFVDLTEAQTAQVLGVAVGTVKRLHFDALARLRDLSADLLESADEMSANEVSADEVEVP